LLSSLVFVVTLIGRLATWRPWIASMLELLFGPTLIAMGIVEQLRGRGDHGLLVAAGILVTIFASGIRNARWRPTLIKVAFPLKLAAIGLAFVGLIGGYRDLTWPCLIVFWSLTGPFDDRTNQRTPRASVDRATASASR
jgi:hypothetical protein